MRTFGTTSASRAGPRTLAIAFATILASCSTTPTTGGTSLPPSPPPRAAPARADAKPAGLFVPCSDLSVVKFNALDPDSDIQETAANVFDTPETIAPTRKNNAAIHEVCGK